jgi:transposase
MPKKIDPELKARAVRLVCEHRGEYPTLTAASQAVAKQVGVGKESVRRWVIQAEIDAGHREGVTSEESDEIRRFARAVGEVAADEGDQRVMSWSPLAGTSLVPESDSAHQHPNGGKVERCRSHMSRALPPLVYVLGRHATLSRSGGWPGRMRLWAEVSSASGACGGAYLASVMSYVGLMIETLRRSWSVM